MFNVAINNKRLENLETLQVHLCLQATAKFSTVVPSLSILHFHDRLMGAISPE